jgi:hypothetical protein
MTEQRDLARIRLFHGVDHLSGGVEGQTRDGDSGTGNVPAPSVTLFLLMPFATHACVQGVGYLLQSGIRPVQWTDCADRENFAPLLWADSDPIGDGSAQNLRHSMVVFRTL